jgi:mono/diheme cytochrome c family protein
MSRRPIELGCTLVFVALLSWPLGAAGSQAAPAPATPATAAQIAEGAKVFAAQKCSICHSIAGVGNKKLPLDGVGAKLTSDQIREWITHPVEAAKKADSTAKPPMRAYPKLAKPELDALVAYMKSLDKK